jgi:hypothetical protein
LVSDNVPFDQNAFTQWRYHGHVFRMHGQPWWNAAITPENGSNTLSCFVTIAAR